jgi:hypothetical protein
MQQRGPPQLYGCGGLPNGLHLALQYSLNNSSRMYRSSSVAWCASLVQLCSMVMSCAAVTDCGASVPAHSRSKW